MENRQSLVRYAHPGISLRIPGAIENRSVVPQQLSIQDICRTVAKRKTLILTFAAIVLCFAAAYAFLKTPVYEGVARLQIDPTRSTSLGLENDKNSMSSADVDGRIKTQAQILQSDTVAMQVMKDIK